MEAKLSSAREAAFSALMSCEKQGAWSDQAIRSAARKWALSARDAALASNLCYGVVQNQLLLDFWINAFSTTPAVKLNPEVRISLRMALYQLHFLDRIPASAAVNESVGLVCKYTRNKGAAGLTNAVLRSFQRAERPPQPAFSDPLQTLSVRYSHPLPLVRLLSAELGGDVESLLATDNAPTDMVIQCNTLKTTVNALKDELECAGVAVQIHPWLKDCLMVHRSGDLEQLAAFRRGAFYVQDVAAKLCILAAAPKPGDRVLDACAAPGGKSFAAALSMDAVPILADLVGGVPVTIDTDMTAVDPRLLEGETVTLEGELALSYVRARQIVSDGTNQSRMARQERFLQASWEAWKKKTASGDAVELGTDALVSLGERLRSDCTVQKLSRFLERIEQCELTVLPAPAGEAKISEENIAEFYVDDDALEQTVLKLFYREEIS